MPTGVWRRRPPLPVAPDLVAVCPIGEATPEEVKRYREARTEIEESDEMDLDMLAEAQHTIRVLTVDLAAARASIAELEKRIQTVRDAWSKACDEDDLQPQGFGWPGDLFDALEALDAAPDRND